MWDNAIEQNNQNTMSDTVIKYNKTSDKVVKMYIDQQRSALVTHIMKCFSCLPLSLTYVLSLNRH